MSLLARIADRLVLCPSTHPVDSGELIRETIAVKGGELEAWTGTFVPGEKGESDDSPPVLLIKFPGTGGRAERSTPNPAHLWQGVTTAYWTINPFGYGGSTGPATLQRYPEMVEAVFESLHKRYPDHRIVVYGSSLGSISALAMVARFPVHGLFLRNPVPIHQLISTRPRYVWPSLGMSRWVARQIPEYLDTVANARNSHVPCLFVSSGSDRLVPPAYQSLIFRSYAGESRVFTIPGADHQDSIPESMGDAYLADVRWFGDQVHKS